MEYFVKLRAAAASIEPWWTVVLVPLWQEFVFRFLPYRLWYLQTERFWLIGIISSVAFAAIHWYFGKWFILWAFVAGVFQWWVMVHYGFLAVVIVHAIINVVDVIFGLRTFIIR